MTYTLRTTTSLGGQLSSGQMRSWIAEFLRRPRSLPADPGAGEYRLSLNLSDESVRDVAGTPPLLLQFGPQANCLECIAVVAGTFRYADRLCREQRLGPRENQSCWRGFSTSYDRRRNFRNACRGFSSPVVCFLAFCHISQA